MGKLPDGVLHVCEKWNIKKCEEDIEKDLGKYPDPDVETAYQEGARHDPKYYFPVDSDLRSKAARMEALICREHPPDRENFLYTYRICERSPEFDWRLATRHNQAYAEMTWAKQKSQRELWAALQSHLPAFVPTTNFERLLRKNDEGGTLWGDEDCIELPRWDWCKADRGCTIGPTPFEFFQALAKTGFFQGRFGGIKTLCIEVQEYTWKNPGAPGWKAAEKERWRWESDKPFECWQDVFGEMDALPKTDERPWIKEWQHFRDRVAGAWPLNDYGNEIQNTIKHIMTDEVVKMDKYEIVHCEPGWLPCPGMSGICWTSLPMIEGRNSWYFKLPLVKPPTLLELSRRALEQQGIRAPF